MPRVKKAIIPAAGLGTRFLPATKTVPKEMLTIVDAPIILYVVEEAVKAGIEDIILIAGRGKHAIEDFFDTSYELEDKLAKDGKEKLLERVTRIRDSANIISIRQKQAMGLGHAVLCGLPIVGKEPFAVLLGDEITMGFHGEPNVTSQLVSSFEETGTSTISVMKVEDKDVSKYGIAEIEEKSTGFFKVTSLVEKPKANETSSRWALPGRYVFDNAIMDILQNAKPTLNGEIQLTDSMKVLCAQHGLNAMTFTAQRFDAGDKLGYLQANIELALQSPELNQELKSYILSLAEKLK
ncbi:UTP--glucose-1-phosphate uridylyltransferase GalU [Bdellovibrio bacteriovorus]|uniref:UTP--glucose-1-phosphate uridylyltransferase n=1 Tax=Bdellovibrio bacteriovorus str. Tiberius TaxID=1069642 RepID=K7ZHB7_BDEBC|nr:UTP--glucose-1-phosphate uridylyltransferase GalU [Bdellovibrio bacteriovorus]AFY03327.1 UTP-glucose-1-phosphate uridylyltransferase [Bdellovibrio bacteriovorus str. Tiberius]